MVVAGADIFTQDEGWLKRYMKSSYVRYILNLVDKYRLKNHIVFTGELNEADMCAQYAKTHVFVSPSVIENSPNSVCEAMLLGMPCVCSDVGGIRDLMTHEEQGYIYQSSAPYMLAYYICDLFANDQKAIQFSEAAHERAKQTHDREANVKRTLEIYDIIKREADA